MKADRIGGAAWIAFGLAIFAGAWQMDRYESMGGTLYTAPGLVPGIYGLVMMAMGALLALRRSRGAADATAGDADPGGPLLNRRVALALGLMLVYAIGLVGRVPFGVATATFVAAFCALFDSDAPPRRRAITAIAAGIGTAVVVVLVFERVFLVRLP